MTRKYHLVVPWRRYCWEIRKEVLWHDDDRYGRKTFGRDKYQYLFFAVRTVDGQAEDLSRSSSQDRRPARRGWKELERLIRW